MEWVETTGRTVEEAKEYALDQLGVDEADAEFEVLEEPKLGLFGRLRTEARVRARVRPQAPPPKVDRRERRRRSGPGRDEGGGDEVDAARAEVSGRPERPERPERAERKERGPRSVRQPREVQPSRPPRRNDEGDDVNERDHDRPAPTQAEVDDQSSAVLSFLEGLVDAFGVEADVTMRLSDDQALEAAIDGDDVGLLLGPRGQTLEAVQELARRALQTYTPDSMRLRVDVGGYRERRRAALARFAEKVAQQVLESGEPASLEPMNAADRKVVHDTVNELDGVRTTSEGEEPRRRVVVHPA